MGKKLNVSRNFRKLLESLKNYLKFNKFEKVFSDQDSDKKDFMEIETFLDIIDVEI